ncbi:glycine cleavage system protein GcvH [Rhodococcus sp. BP-349]|uniref:Glycine cleavage system H protein n=1 Tax=Rhodococcoides corynebacterioides TaxID=53972 RepID=A0ABS2KRA0_9NOCA|nr:MULTISPECIES: glycine cleavage system protein GcvH [Rhodococcus]KQU34861.1 glycine cleavage system protein H [Rhodococcus sp. Leaf225]KQU45624.1 glycine cleavage system protein H [Rhodococcus sp. Leaf258]MBM7414490.1 glycine cleavage system H protein [Rhodococcus corynebacterioides]MBP1116953.1 glycine cleavage system H protein [Rhodococcus sp. PvP016]MBY6541357.1 glycine cleavage system protein GcvH [Rhodococcus sp. BP-363]
MSQTDIPTELRYTAEHEWVQRTGPTTVRVGVTDYAQSQLGDVVFVQLPTEDDAVSAGESLGEVESTKSVSDIYAPLSAKVVAVNGELDGDPELVNSDPYGAGWLVDLSVDSESDLDDALEAMMDAEGYASITTT